MSEKIRNIGTIQKIDKDGYIINNLSLKNIQSEYKTVLEDTLNFYKTHFQKELHSIYIRGSVAKGEAIPFISDLDTMAISKRDIDRKEVMPHISFWDEMKSKYEYLNGVEIYFQSIDKVKSSRKIQFLLQTQCICVYGENIRLSLPKFKIGEWAYAHSNNIEDGIEKMKLWFKEENTDEELKGICSWAMKRTVRIGFELIMDKEQCFTRDLYPCYELFSKYYPEKSEEMRQALKLAIYPTCKIPKMWTVLNSLTEFLIEEAKKRNARLKNNS